MKTHLPPAQPRLQGFALMTTICLLGICLLAFASILAWSYSNSQLTQQNNQYNMSQNAAEAAMEMVVGHMDRDFIEQSISNTAGAYTTIPITIDQSSWPVQYTFSDTNGNSGQVSVNIGAVSTTIVPANSQYSNLLAQSQQVDVYVTATPSGRSYNVPATVHESVQFAGIPLFQYAVFYNVNLEVMSGQTLDIWGPVFCNQNIWEGSSITTFHSTVNAVGTNSTGTADPFSADYVGTGASTFSLAGQPVSHSSPVVMPIGTNNQPQTVLAMLQLPPASYAMGTANAYSSNGLAYPANEADLVVTNFYNGTNSGTSALPYGTNFLVYFQDSGLAPLPYDYYIITNNYTHGTFSTNFASTNFLASITNHILNYSIYYAGYTWLTNVIFYDWREAQGWTGTSLTPSGPPKLVQAVQLDVSLLNVWITNTTANGGSDTNASWPAQPTKILHSGHGLNSMYFITSVPFVTGQLPAVRVTNGKQLPPAGLGLATSFPLYIWKDYNVQTDSSHSVLGLNGTTTALAYTYPACCMADSISILSDNWTDTGKTWTSGGPTASSTTINAGMLEGIVQTNPHNTSNPAGYNGDYSGGVENFMRLLENWTGQTLTYNGSIVVLFYSEYATNYWRQTGGYYSAPTRHWAFDLNFENSSKIPPLTPKTRAMIRGNWYAHQ
jgi:hypothetical protein